MTKSNTLLARCMLVMGVISVLSVGCKKAVGTSRGGSTESESLGTEQSSGTAPQGEATPEEVVPEEAVPHVPDPTEIE